MKEPVQMIKVELDHIPIEDKTAFAFRPDKPMQWLQRVCFSFLRRLGAYSMPVETKEKRFVIDADNFMEKLFSARQDLLHCFGRTPVHLFIGAEDYQNLMKEMYASSAGFEFTTRYRSIINNGDEEIMGLRVHVVPWMRGMLVMPSIR